MYLFLSNNSLKGNDVKFVHTKNKSLFINLVLDLLHVNNV